MSGVDEEKNKYIPCCCCNCDVTSVTVVGSILILIGATVNLLQVYSGNFSLELKVISAVANVTFCVFAILAIIGTCKWNPYLVAPLFIALIVSSIGSCVAIAVYVIESCTAVNERMHRHYILAAVAFLIELPFSICSLLFMSLRLFSFSTQWQTPNRSGPLRRNSRDDFSFNNARSSRVDYNFISCIGSCLGIVFGVVLLLISTEDEVRTHGAGAKRTTISIVVLVIIGAAINLQQLLNANIVLEIKLPYGVVNLVFCVSAILAIIGTDKGSPYLLLPLTVTLLTACVGSCIKITLTGKSLYFGENKKTHAQEMLVALGFAVCLLFFAWSINVTKQCYRYLKRCRGIIVKNRPKLPKFKLSFDL
ncbi:hypothetical protein QR680_015577 [Steinernema hermaphroditum]|uniref:Uncharacterized protein n=1 Tax=Steinernema hermaphroditum TaxID=289476 RepID=A0AA39HAG5_9BILA|nr:hypothetical protein QR680_015577 [Steinernema hermaphroditum]